MFSYSGFFPSLHRWSFTYETCERNLWEYVTDRQTDRQLLLSVIQRYASTKLEVSMAFLFPENRRHMPYKTDEWGNA